MKVPIDSGLSVIKMKIIILSWGFNLSWSAKLSKDLYESCLAACYSIWVMI